MIELTEIDAAIIRSTETRWMKTAMIIARADKVLRAANVDVDFEAIGKRVAALAASGQIEVAGDIMKWRHSEVRLAQV